MKLFDTGNSQMPNITLSKKSGYAINYREDLGVFEIDIPDGKLFYHYQFFNEKISDRSVEYLLANKEFSIRKTDWRNVDPSTVKWENINWKQDQIKMFGKDVLLPRYSAWHGDNNKSYTYSGITLTPSPWNKGLNYLKEAIEPLAKVNFNSVLLNWYRDGEDSISWHTDAEKELGTNPVIGSVNFGATRKFQLRRKDNKKEKISIPLGHGTLLIMSGTTQHFWQHAVLKEKKIKDLRINLTFRVIK